MQTTTIKTQHKMLLDNKTEKSTGRVWVQVASAGEFKGYAGGEKSFTFDQALFQQIVDNFRAHPQYAKAADGVGTADIIAFDFHHASEMPATSGSIPGMGAPAQGWIQELGIRLSAGVPQLWALTRWLEPAKTYIKEGRYQGASVSVAFDAVNPVTGLPVGAMLTSVALTNQPFIEGMERLAASRGGASHNSPTIKPKAKTMSDLDRIIAAYPQFIPNASTPAVALEKAARYVVKGGAQLPRRILYEKYVGPALRILNGGKTQRVQVVPENLPVIDVRACAGRNSSEKLVAHVHAQRAGLTHDQATLSAMELRRSHKIVA